MPDKNPTSQELGTVPILTEISKGTFPVFLISISDVPDIPKAMSISCDSTKSNDAISSTINFVPLLSNIPSSDVVFIEIVFISPFWEDKGIMVLIIILEYSPGASIIETELVRPMGVDSELS